MGTPIDRVVGRGFRVTRGGRARGNLAMGNGGGRVETVLSNTEETEYDTDWKASFTRYTWSILCAALYHASGSVSAGHS